MTIDASRESAFPSRRLTKTLLIMKLTVIMLVLSLPIFAKGRAQERVTLSEKNASLEVVLKEIQKQTGYQYFFQDKWKAIAKKIDISVSNAALDDVLSICFKDQPFTYTLINKIIVVQEKQPGKVEDTPSPQSNEPTQVRGKVITESGAPLSGATVTLKGSKKGAFTNSNGEFVLQGVTPGKYTLEVSFVGYNPFSMTIIAGRSDVTAILQMATNSLDEAQVIAYGEVSKRLQTGNVTTVKGEDIEKQPVGNPLLALEGRVPGLFITQTNGLPGNAVKVVIQGKNSILKGNDPFYVVDGVPYTSQLSQGIGSILGTGTVLNSIPSYGSPFNYINPSDIESIEVLKDADATAIYGSRAANGAILITTKKGMNGRTRIDINLQNGWSKVGHNVKMLTLPQYLQMRNEALHNDNLTADSTSDFDLTLWDTTRYTDWQKALIGGTAQYTNLSASISGGTTNTQYLIGSTFHRETTVFPGSFADQKGSVHFNLGTVSVNKKFRVQFSTNYMIDNNRLPQSDLTSYAAYLPPDAPALYNSDESLNWALNSAGASTWTNPLAGNYNKYTSKVNNLISNIILNYEILPGLDVRSSFGYTNLEQNEIVVYPLKSTAPDYQQYTSRFAQYSNQKNDSWIIEPQLSYKRNIAKGKLEVLIGTTIQQNNRTGQILTASGYNSDLVLEDINSASSIFVSASVNSQYKYNAAFGRLNYNWQNKYLLNLTARRDGSSRFGYQNRFNDFGSLGAAWIYSQEGFIKKQLPFISFGKLRCSYGTTGNDQIGDYQFLNLYTPNTVDVPYQGTTGLAPNALTNPYLQWELTKKLQFGWDIGVFKDRILFNANYFINRSSNELLNNILPIITGFTSITRNFPATVQNFGWEFSLNTINLKTKEFSWTSSVNLTIPKNKLASFVNFSSSPYASLFIIGQPTTIVKAYHFWGVDPATGVYQFTNNLGKQTSNPNPFTDRIDNINTAPKLFGGMINSFAYKGFEVDIFLQFVSQTGYNDNHFGNSPGARFTNEPVSVLSRWQKPGDITTIQRYNSDYSIYTQNSDARLSNASYENASYIRLKSLSLSWNLSQISLKKSHLQNCKIYVQGQNLLTFTNYKGLDPETLTASTLPPLRVLTVGLQVGL